MRHRFSLALLATLPLLSSHVMAAENDFIMSKEGNQHMFAGGNSSPSEEETESYGGDRASPEPSYGGNQPAHRNVEASGGNTGSAAIVQPVVSNAGYASTSTSTSGTGISNVMQALQPMLNSNGYAQQGNASHPAPELPAGWSSPENASAGGTGVFSGGLLSGNGMNSMMQSLGSVLNNANSASQRNSSGIGTGTMLGNLNSNAAGYGQNTDSAASAREQAMYMAFLTTLLQYVMKQPDGNSLSANNYYTQPVSATHYSSARSGAARSVSVSQKGAASAASITGTMPAVGR